MEVEWACSLFMSPTAPFDEGLLTPELQKRRAEAPRLFAHYYDHKDRDAFLAERGAYKPPKNFVSKMINSVRKRLKA
jgi:hypothetical protein